MSDDDDKIPQHIDAARDEAEPNLRTVYGMACPHCEAADSFTIDIVCSAQLTATGSVAIGDHYWDDTSDCFCDDCGHNDTVGAFRIPEAETAAT